MLNLLQHNMWKVINKFGDVVLRNLTASELVRFIGQNLGNEYKYKEQKLTIKQRLLLWISKN